MQKQHFRKYSTDPGFGGIGILAEDHLSELPEVPGRNLSLEHPSWSTHGQHLLEDILCFRPDSLGFAGK